MTTVLSFQSQHPLMNFWFGSSYDDTEVDMKHYSLKKSQLSTFHQQYGISFLQKTRYKKCTVIRALDVVTAHKDVTESSPIKILNRRSQTHVEPSHNHEETLNEENEEENYIQIVGLSKQLVQQRFHSLCESYTTDDLDQGVMDDSQIEIVKLIDNGPSENRIDVVFMGDGYTSREKDKFFEDITRLVNDMWSGSTFKSTLPLFNVWAVFVPSADSGIGIGGKPKDTAFGLYRDGTELRGIYCSKRSFAQKVCRKVGKFACDYPSLIANDDFYGGLGGEFVISTRSETSGTIVLRHEMGHNFVSVGEEYDGGYVYSGCNAAKSLHHLPWSHWLSNISSLREEPSSLAVQRYAWHDLGKGEYRIPFTSSGLYQSWLLQVSVSGMDSNQDMEVTLDGKPLPWNASGNLDRFFLDWKDTKGLANGTHELIFRQVNPPQKGGPIRQLCSVVLHEYKDDYRFENSIIGAYPTVSLYGFKSYRPTNEGCLMRNMTHNRFCSVCQEGLWENLLTQMSLIDGFDVACQVSKSNIIQYGLIGRGFSRKPSLPTVNIALRLVSLGSLRSKNKQLVPVLDERYEIDWLVNGQSATELKDRSAIQLDKIRYGTNVTAIVKLHTKEVRKPNADFMTSSETVIIKKRLCNS